MTSENIFENTNNLPADLQHAKKWVYDKHDLIFTNPKLYSEGVEYGACSFQLNGKKIEHRVSKITPTKIGQFVTIWKRNKDGITQPFDLTDDMDFIIVTARAENNFGQFIFPKSILAEQGVISNKGKGGKRGIRVYPPWDRPTSKQAEKTQAWQIKYFFMINEELASDVNAVKKLLTS